jgi:hypothetical protein
MHERGHQIGIHQGYTTYNNKQSSRGSIDKLLKILDKGLVTQDMLDSRHRYFRFDVLLTSLLWEESKLD